MPIPVAAIGSLLQFAPKVMGLFGKDEPGNKVMKAASVIGDIAQDLTGKSDPEDMRAAMMADPNLALEFERSVMDNQWVGERLTEQSRERASKQYAVNPDMANKIAERVMKYNLPVIMVLAVVNCVTIYTLKNEGAIIGLVSTIIGGIIGNLVAERASIVAFFFGSSLGSKAKDKTDG